MIWKSRAGKHPPPKFFAEVAAYLSRAHKGATVSKETMETLRPFLTEQWQQGRNAKIAAEATCACDGKTIVPSPATKERLLKGEVRAPQGALRGEVFGASELRESPDIWKLRNRIAQEQRLAEAAKQRAEKAQASGNKSRAASSRASAAQREVLALKEAKRHHEEALRVEKELSALLAQREKERARLVQETAALAKSASPPPAPAERPKKPKKRAAPRAATAARAATPAKTPASPTSSSGPPASSSDLAARIKRHNAESV